MNTNELHNNAHVAYYAAQRILGKMINENPNDENANELVNLIDKLHNSIMGFENIIFEYESKEIKKLSI